MPQLFANKILIPHYPRGLTREEKAQIPTYHSFDQLKITMIKKKLSYSTLPITDSLVFDQNVVNLNAKFIGTTIKCIYNNMVPIP